MSSIPTIELHTPDELLSNATAMYASGDPKFFRGAILESITALETFVHRTVFNSLRGKLDPQLVLWLEEKTRMDFDSRLAVLTPVATGLSVDKSSKLWGGYKKAKDIRNKVVHSGRKVTASDVVSVMETVREWLSYLSSTIELEAALLELKRWVEQIGSLTIENEAQAIQLVVQFFQQATAAKTVIEVEFIAEGRRRRADVILDFGPRKALVETKFVRDGRNPKTVTRDAVDQVDALRRAAGIRQACVIIFLRGSVIGVPDKVERHRDGEIFSVCINVP